MFTPSNLFWLPVFESWISFLSLFFCSVFISKLFTLPVDTATQAKGHLCLTFLRLRIRVLTPKWGFAFENEMICRICVMFWHSYFLHHLLFIYIVSSWVSVTIEILNAKYAKWKHVLFVKSPIYFIVNMVLHSHEVDFLAICLWNRSQNCKWKQPFPHL